jgi:hypothetical protein
MISPLLHDANMQFNCPKCNALYNLIKVEAGPEAADRKLRCLRSKLSWRSEGRPLPQTAMGSLCLKL